MGKYDNVELPRDITELYEITGHRFSDPELLCEALTHSSYANEHRALGLSCNERLEFLGDSVLSLVTSEYIYKRYPTTPEGELTRMRAELVCEKALSGYSREIELGSFLLLGRGEEKGGGRERRSIIADAFEALLAAIYLDAADEGEGKEEVKKFLLPLLKSAISKLLAEWHGADYKTLLQQLVQRSEGELLEYVTVSESGPDHDPVFEVEARLNSNVIGKGRAHTKRDAEQAAAAQALSLFGEI